MPPQEESDVPCRDAEKYNVEEARRKAAAKRASVKARMRLPKWVTMRDELVISGLSGIYPCSLDTKAYMDNLYAGVDMVMSSNNGRWPTGRLLLSYIMIDNGK